MFAPLKPRAEGNWPMSLEFSADAQKKIDALIKRYPSTQPVVLAALHLAQKEHGHLSDEALQLVARTLDLPLAHVFGVATFYTMFRREPAGKNVLRVCTNISCMLRGGYDVLAAFEKKLGVKKGGTAGDFTIVEEECIAACANAPAVICGTRYFLDVKPAEVDSILDELRRAPRLEGEVV
jgi:NADH-quinone oxidoreductase E subunit